MERGAGGFGVGVKERFTSSRLEGAGRVGRADIVAGGGLGAWGVGGRLVQFKKRVPRSRTLEWRLYLFEGLPEGGSS